MASSSDPENRMEGLEGVPNEPTLSGCEESGLDDMSPVLYQQSYYANKRLVIKSALAIESCSELSVDKLLEKLSGILGTSYALETRSESLRSALKSCIERGYDFGTAYARLRPYWFEDTSRDIVEDERKDQDMRKQLLANKKIIDGDAPPRRVWDLYANRVVPFWVVRKYPWAISHAWVNDKELKRVRTPINQNEWPVPIPQDTNLDLIRIEMLNLGAEYVWLDVLCMRQKLREKGDEGLPEILRKEVVEGKRHLEGRSLEDVRMELRQGWSRGRWGQEVGAARLEAARREARGEEEELRLEEWKVDVPTIGWVYRKADQVVCYFGGFGQPLAKVDLESDQCWFNRAWMLQEMNIDPIIAGRSQDGDIMEEGLPLPAKFHEQLASLRQMRRDDFVFDILSKMQTRKSTKPVDRIAALVYLFHSEYIPIYVEDQFEEDAWTALLNVTQDWFQADLFFFYPKPGKGKKFWRPSWSQAMEHTVSWRDPSQVMGKIKWWKWVDIDSYYGPSIESGEVRGLGNATDASAQKTPRRGELCLKDPKGVTHTFKIIADHTYSISDGTYTLMSSTGFPSTQTSLLWVVGKVKGIIFEKLSVFSMADDRAAARLQRLGVAKDRQVVLR